MYNDILKIGGVTIHGWGLMIGLGVLCAILAAEYRAKKRGLNTDQVFNIFFLVLIFGFIGAKLLFCLVEIETILKNPMLILSGDGFVIYGGIIGGIAAVMIYCRIKKVSFLTYLDLLVPSVALAQGFGRIGCFLAGCCYGRETESFFGITFQNSQFAPNGVRLIPTELIMSAGDFIIAAALLLYARKDRKNGRVGGLYIILYSVGRFAVEFLRGDDIRGFVGGLSTAQFISIFTLIFGLVLFCTNAFNRKKDQPAEKPVEEPEPVEDEKDGDDGKSE
jgi:phosphatidylglycerol:prolipoprotein diacylglycerol transferase